MDENKVLITQYLDEPPRFLFWSIDEAMLILVPTFLGLCCGFFITGIFIAIVSLLALRKLKLRLGSTFILAAVYWYFPWHRKLWHALPPSHIREYVG